MSQVLQSLPCTCPYRIRAILFPELLLQPKKRLPPFDAHVLELVSKSFGSLQSVCVRRHSPQRKRWRFTATPYKNATSLTFEIDSDLRGNAPGTWSVVAVIDRINSSHRFLASLLFDDMRDKAGRSRDHKNTVERGGIHS